MAILGFPIPSFRFATLSLTVFGALISNPAVGQPSRPERASEAVESPRFSTRIKEEDDGNVRIFLIELAQSRYAEVQLTGDLRANDEIVLINGHEVATMARAEWTKALTPYSQIMIRRRGPDGKYSHLEVKCSRRLALDSRQLAGQ